MKIVRDISVTGRAPRPGPAAPGWSPQALFPPGAAGGFYDPAVPGTAWADTAGTQPAVPGDPVARLDAAAGPGAPLLQATAAARPVLRLDAAGAPYLEMNGVNRWLAGAVDLGPARAACLALALAKDSDTFRGTPAMFGSFGTAALLAFAPYTAGSSAYEARIAGSATVRAFSPDTRPAPDRAALVVLADAAAPELVLRLDGAEVARTSADPGVAALGAQALTLGALPGGASPLHGRLHAVCLVAGTPAAPDLAALETWLAARGAA